MKIKNIFFAALATLAFFACSNDDSISTKDVRSVSVSLSGLEPATTTRSSDPANVFTADTINVTSVLINLTDAGGTVIVSKLINKDAVLNSDWYKLTTPGQGLKFINTSRSVSKVFVYGNPGTAVGNTNVVSTTLPDQQGSHVLYYGVDEDLTPVQTEPVNPDPTDGQTYTANVTIVPIVARLQIKSISFKNAGNFTYTRQINNAPVSANVTWTGFTGNVKGIYLNNIYHKYNRPGTLDEYLQVLTYVGAIQEGNWLFTPPGPTLNAASFASYRRYTEESGYANLPLSTPNKCYAFNIFPGTEVPKLHLDLSDLVITGLASTNTEVFNPALAPSFRFANIVKFYKNVNTEMVASDFVPGKIYNMDIELIPSLDTDLKNMQYNVMVHVTIAPWGEETIVPGFELNQ
ncbi:hypothetical protein CLV62_13912 [Dysgonomonas alginatilytica]|uniref:Major fimbrial subunit protein N-terminal domain-containing protein n=2 Tax=Dysgonomonas alginatilytica TaxID=1605892 RepID=A0A2V3PKY9_9BACT|nr:hypothetical protein CLV62_13912 [Dysgonomonas alginatilytica]